MLIVSTHQASISHSDSALFLLSYCSELRLSTLILKYIHWLTFSVYPYIGYRMREYIDITRIIHLKAFVVGKNPILNNVCLG